MSARVCLPLMFILAAMCAPPAFALEPAELILIVNKNEPASGELAAYYARVRGVPAENIIPLDLPKDESISRRDYEAKLLRPLREAIGSRRDKIRCLVCMYGVPLRVGDQEFNAAMAALRPASQPKPVQARPSEERQDEDGEIIVRV